MFTLITLKNYIQKKRVVRLSFLIKEWRKETLLLTMMLEQLCQRGYIKKFAPISKAVCKTNCGNCQETEDTVYVYESVSVPVVMH